MKCSVAIVRDVLTQKPGPPPRYNFIRSRFPVGRLVRFKPDGRIFRVANWCDHTPDSVPLVYEKRPPYDGVIARTCDLEPVSQVSKITLALVKRLRIK